MRTFLLSMTRNPVSLLGTALTTASALLFLGLFGVEILGHPGSPYIGIITFMVLPGVFLLGLLLVPLGVWWRRRRERAGLAAGQPFPVLDLNRDTVRRTFLTVAALTLVNVVILGLAAYKGVETMESTSFCGQACHSVMAPEFSTYSRSPHSRVQCVSCHIGPGASWFVKSKLSGAWQVVSVNLDLYPRPIPAPVHNLRPARETCEQCHWPTKFVGDRLKVKTHFSEDEANTETKTVLLVRVGGSQGIRSHGIHWHVDPGVTIRYRSDEKRETIHEVELTQGNEVLRYAVDGAPEGGTWRTMDCVDCHNRPTHVYKSAEEELDAAIEAGGIDRTLPWIRRQGLIALKKDYPSHEAATEGIKKEIGEFYRADHADTAGSKAKEIGQAAETLAAIYRQNVWPSMRIAWGTYPNHIGHTYATGCFRCHDDLHATTDGKTISQDCSTCHTLLAIEEQNPAIMGQLNP